MNRVLRLFWIAGAIMSGVALLLVGLMLGSHVDRGYPTKRLFLGLLVAMGVNLYLVWKTRSVSK